MFLDRIEDANSNELVMCGCAVMVTGFRSLHLARVKRFLTQCDQWFHDDGLSVSLRLLEHLKVETNMMSEKEAGKHGAQGDQPDQQARAARHQIHHLAFNCNRTGRSEDVYCRVLDTFFLSLSVSGRTLIRTEARRMKLMMRT